MLAQANAGQEDTSLTGNDRSRLSSRHHQVIGVKSKQVDHVFGSCNSARKRIHYVKNEIDLIEQVESHVKRSDTSSTTYLKSLDEEAWCLVSTFGSVFSGLSSRRCVVASVINGTGTDLQVKSTGLMEGASQCYALATRDYDTEQGILHPGGVIIFFGWGLVPSLVHPGNVILRIETNGFVSELATKRGPATYATAMPGFQVGFLEKSYDDSGWWAKYWLLIRT